MGIKEVIRDKHWVLYELLNLTPETNIALLTKINNKAHGVNYNQQGS